MHILFVLKRYFLMIVCTRYRYMQNVLLGIPCW